MVARGDIAVEVGRALRRARTTRGMTLRDVGKSSGGRFKPTAVAGYERAERAISLERFCELTRLYQMAPERLLAQIMWRLAGRPEPILDGDKVSELLDDEADVVGAFIQRVRDLRRADAGDIITVRIQDLEVLATASGHDLQDFLDHLRPASAGNSSHP
jgi:transcriptional regulator with XRE-family HTH domain